MLCLENSSFWVINNVSQGNYVAKREISKKNSKPIKHFTSKGCLIVLSQQAIKEDGEIEVIESIS